MIGDKLLAPVLLGADAIPSALCAITQLTMHEPNVDRHVI